MGLVHKYDSAQAAEYCISRGHFLRSAGLAALGMAVFPDNTLESFASSKPKYVKMVSNGSVGVQFYSKRISDNYAKQFDWAKDVDKKGSKLGRGSGSYADMGNAAGKPDNKEIALGFGGYIKAEFEGPIIVKGIPGQFDLAVRKGNSHLENFLVALGIKPNAEYPDGFREVGIFRRSLDFYYSSPMSQSAEHPLPMEFKDSRDIIFIRCRPDLKGIYYSVLVMDIENEGKGHAFQNSPNAGPEIDAIGANLHRRLSI